MSDADGEDTESTALRWRYTNDLLAGALVATLCVAVLYDIHFGATLNDRVWMALVVESGLAATWAFGTETVTAFKQLRK